MVSQVAYGEFYSHLLGPLATPPPAQHVLHGWYYLTGGDLKSRRGLLGKVVGIL